MKGQIQSALLGIERAEGVCIIYACESGSRAWGFASPDSDYDVRFLYARPKEWYLSINVEEKSDVIERPGGPSTMLRAAPSGSTKLAEVLSRGGELDIVGWDLRKALKLFRKSNPPLLEWLRSPIVYLDKFGIAEQLRSLLPDYYSPTACLCHYLHMAKGNFREYLQGDIVWLKKYLYVLRPLLAIRWIEAGRGIVPTELDALLNHTVESPDVKREILLLVERKKRGAELDRGPRVPVISEFIERELTRLEAKTMPPKDTNPGSERLNELFRETLETVSS